MGGLTAGKSNKSVAQFAAIDELLYDIDECDDDIDGPTMEIDRLCQGGDGTCNVALGVGFRELPKELGQRGKHRQHCRRRAALQLGRRDEQWRQPLIRVPTFQHRRQAASQDYEIK